MHYIKVPNEIDINTIKSNSYSLSPSQYKTLSINNTNLLYFHEFLDRKITKKDLGVEVGSLSYIDHSPVSFIKTKALQENSFLPKITNESTKPIIPNSFVQMNLKENDFLISKDSNIGEAVILDKDYTDFMLSGAIYRLPISKWKFYLFAIVKHNIFKEQLDFIVPKSATIRHAKTHFLNVKIPIPNYNSDNIIKFIEILIKAVINKEKEIQAKNYLIYELIKKELINNQNANNFHYSYPTNNELLENGRLDAGFYCKEHQKLLFPIKNYKYGYSTLDKQGMKLISGPSLELKILGTRIDSKKYLPGFFRLITPKQITDFGTIEYYEYIGISKKISPLQYGDVLFGESGTGRSMVYLEHHKNTINNAHAHILRPLKDMCTIEKAIFIRSILAYYKNIGIIDYMSVGGQGGHLSPSYFDRILIPNFPDNKQKDLAKLYFNPIIKINTKDLTLNNYLEKDNKFNENAGITEIDHSIKIIKQHLNFLIDQIVNDIEININFSFLDQLT